MHRPSTSACPWAASPEEEAEKPEEGVKAEPLSVNSREARMQKPSHKMGLAVGAGGRRLAVRY